MCIHVVTQSNNNEQCLLPLTSESLNGYIVGVANDGFLCSKFVALFASYPH